MPTYEYVCDACGHLFERVQRFSEEPVRDCPRCRRAAVRRVIHPTGIIFKGSGWYSTDHGRSGGRRGSSGESTTEKKDKDSAGAKTDAKTESASSSPAVDTDG